MKKIILSIITVTVSTGMYAQIYMAKTCEISFLSKTPVEDIAAVNKAAKPLLNTATGDLQIKIVMAAFVFAKPLMEEHFNENYVESDKYPNAFFKGKINETIDYTKDGEYKVTATGKLTIHGIEKDRTIDGTLSIKNGTVTLKSAFKVTFADHGIIIPALYSEVIPPITDVKINALLEPFKKN
jgi:hypothetical protein